MKKIRNILLVLFIIVILLMIFLKIFVWGFAPKLDKPESVAYDPVGERFLVSNVGSGSIIAMDENGNYSKYMPKMFAAPKGILLKDGLLYVTDPTEIHVVDVSEAAILESYPIDGAIGLNDIAITEHNLIYITDTAGNCVYIYDPETGTQEKIINPLFDKPNGIIYDKPRWQMFVVNNSQHSPILSLDVQTKDVSIFMDTVYSNLDGIAIDDLGRIYFSSWSAEMIIEIPQEQNRFITNLKDIKGAADIYYHQPTNELIAPLLKHNRIDRINLD
jgi:sugar lactone lactonase YvrE